MTPPLPSLHIVIASTRPGRSAEPVGRWFSAHAEHHGSFNPSVIDLADVGLPMVDEPAHPMLRQYTQEHTRAWSAQVEEADAFVFVTPEYNHGYPAVLKNALDFLYFEWHHKPVGFVSYGAGIAGGTRAVQALKQVVLSLKMVPLAEGVHLPFIYELVMDGTLRVPEAVDAAAASMLDELARTQRAIGALREAAEEFAGGR